MEKILLRTIREAFKVAFINKLINESSEGMARKLSAQELQKAEELYHSWISGSRRGRLHFGDLDEKTENYLIEKAVEEYKQSKSKQIHDAISTFYYPDPNYGSRKMYNIISKDGAVNSNRAKLANPEDFEVFLGGAYAERMINPVKFDEIVDKYNIDSDTGVGGLFKTYILNAVRGEASTQSTQKKGGSSISKSLDSGGSDDEGNRKFDLSGGVDVDVETNELLRQLSADKLKETFDTIKQRIEGGDVVFKNPLIKLVFVNYFDGLKASETFAKYKDDEILKDLIDRKTIQKGGDLNKAIKQIRNEFTSWLKLYFSPTSKLYKLMKDTGIQNGLPENWLEFIHDKKNKFTEIARFISAYNKGIQESDSSDADQEIRRILLSPSSEEDLFESFVIDNMDKIMEEVYKRISK
jgi:hypothetical protein